MSPCSGSENQGIDPPTSRIGFNRIQDDTLSEITEPSRCANSSPRAQMRQHNMGMPDTPPLRAFENSNYQSYEDGYDSDGFQAPIYDGVMSKNDLREGKEELAKVPPGIASVALGESFVILGKMRIVLES